MQIKGRSVGIIFFVVFSALFISEVFAANVGVSPAAIRFEDMIRGGYAQREVTVSIDTNKDVYVDITPFGDFADWINVSSNRVLITQEEKQAKILLIIRPPNNIPNGAYKGGVKFRTSGLGDIDVGQAGSVVSAAVDLSMDISITDVQIVKCRASSISVLSVEEGELLDFQVQIFNDGNVLLRPEVVIDVWDQEQENIVKVVRHEQDTILQTSNRFLSIPSATADLAPGQYWAEVSVPACFVYDVLLTFDVLEEGSLSAEGIINRIIAPVWVNISETMPIDVQFQNVGEKTVDAKFKGQIKRGERLLELLESEELRVVPGSNVSFEFFYTPEKLGKHIVSGRVFYEKKRTFESSATFNVLPKSRSGYIYGGIVIIILFLILYFLWKISKGKKKKRKRRYY